MKRAYVLFGVVAIMVIPVASWAGGSVLIGSDGNTVDVSSIDTIEERQARTAIFKPQEPTGGKTLTQEEKDLVKKLMAAKPRLDRREAIKAVKENPQRVETALSKENTTAGSQSSLGQSVSPLDPAPGTHTFQPINIRSANQRIKEKREASKGNDSHPAPHPAPPFQPVPVVAQPPQIAEGAPQDGKGTLQKINNKQNIVQAGSRVDSAVGSVRR